MNGRSQGQARKSSPPRDRWLSLAVRLFVTAGALGIWFWTQSLIGARALPASGIGDVLVRLKGTALKTAPAWFALGVDVRLPTGDAYNFLGSGALGLKPFIAISGRTKRVTPHVNVGYQWNDSSPLAGDIFTGTSGHLPNQLEYAVGFDAGVNKKFSFAADLLGQEIFHAQGVTPTTFTAANGSTFADNGFIRENINLTNGSVGFKVNPIGTLLVSFNVLVQLNDAGLRSRVVPLVGFSYTF